MGNRFTWIFVRNHLDGVVFASSKDDFAFGKLDLTVNVNASVLWDLDHKPFGISFAIEVGIVSATVE
jgi:hypothetical protein